MVDTSAPVSVTITRRPAHSLAVGATSTLAPNRATATAGWWARAHFLERDRYRGAYGGLRRLVQALAPGRAQVVAAAGATGTAPELWCVRLRALRCCPACLALDRFSAPLRVGDTLTLALSGQDERGKPIPGVEGEWGAPAIRRLPRSSRAPG